MVFNKIDLISQEKLKRIKKILPRKGYYSDFSEEWFGLR